MNDPERTASSGSDDAVSSSLSTKISVIVFWLMIAVGIGVSFYLLHGREEAIAADYVARANGLAYDLDEILHNQQRIGSEQVGQEVARLMRQYRVEAVEIALDKQFILHGHRRMDQVVHSRNFDFDDKSGRRMHGMGMARIHFAPLRETVLAERKRVLLAMGLGMLGFGLLLHWMLRRLLTKPFQEMVQTAKAITHGETALRFPEARSDEFGFLARFINKALDFVTLKQRELRVALDRVRESETRLLAEKNLMQVTLHSIGDAVITTDSAGNVRYLNPVAEELIGCRLGKARGRPVRQLMQLLDEEYRRPVENPVEACLREGQMTSTVEHVVLAREDGSEVEVVNTAAPLRAEEGELVIGAVLVVHDVSRARRMAKQLAYQASHDDLTGLVNRREFERVLARAASLAEPGRNEHAMCYMDLDQFKIVNDTCGHIAGDELLRQFADILRRRIRDTDTVARLGGDEFAILFQHCRMDVAQRIAESLLVQIRAYRFVWQGQAFDVGASIGLISIDSGDQGISDIMSAADVACYAAKDAGRNRVHIYNPDDTELKQRHGEMRWVPRIRKALEENRFRLHGQRIAPVADVNRGAPHHELLVRMVDEEGKLVPPLAFIPVAERYNLMSSIDRWVVQQAFETISANKDIVSGWEFSINISGQSLCEENFLKFVVDAFDRTGVAPEQICFEITETAAVANLMRATRFISVLKGMGCRFSLDDFGTGLSSFRYLQTLMVDNLKIDGSFVRDMVDNPVNRAVVEAANQIGHAMGMRTIAEFVENEEILNVLSEIGVNYAQGYGVAKPVPLEEILAAAVTPARQRSAGA